MHHRLVLLLLCAIGSLMSGSCTDSGVDSASDSQVRIHVSPDGLGDYSTIQAAIDSAAIGAVLMLADGTFGGPGNVDLNLGGKSIVIRSASGNPAACGLDCQGSEDDPHRGFTFESGETSDVRVEGISIVNGYAAGELGSIDVSGGAVHCRNGSSPTFAECIFRDCRAVHCGGAVTLAHDCDPLLINCEFIADSAAWGGAICMVAECEPTIDGCTFIANESAYAGGGAHCQASAPLFVNCLFLDNTAGKGAGIHCTDLCSTRVELSTLDGNVSSYTGGAIYCQSSALALSSSTLVANSAISGGAGLFILLSSSITIEATIIAFSPLGDAIRCVGSDVSVEILCSDFYGNGAGDWVGCATDHADQFGNITVDPLLVDLAAGDYHLLSGSPCSAGQSSCGFIGAWSTEE